MSGAVYDLLDFEAKHSSDGEKWQWQWRNVCCDYEGVLKEDRPLCG